MKNLEPFHKWSSFGELFQSSLTKRRCILNLASFVLWNLFVETIQYSNINFHNEVTSPSCHRTFSSVEDTLISPSYPNQYPISQYCIYDISRLSKSNCGIRLTFEQFLLEEADPQDGFCKSDWLAIDSCVPEGGSRFCGNQTGNTYEYPFQTNAEAFRIIFKSDNTTTRSGFKINYKLLSSCRNGLYWDPPISEIPGTFPTSVPCFTQVTERKGTINSPYFPNNYPYNLDCVYEFIRNSPFTCGVLMRVISFELDDPVDTQAGGACLDFLHTPGCGFICGKINFVWTAKYQPGASSIKFHFHSDETMSKSGFKIAFEQINDCSSKDEEHPPEQLYVPLSISTQHWHIEAPYIPPTSTSIFLIRRNL